ncbi:MAG: hypothetical protein JRI77_11195 [Deltaproteobacteria bacterium]|nr:hypothetical protein [Deltaproteobacteria bacterium]
MKRQQDIRIYLDLGNDDLLSGRKILENHDGRLFHLLHMRRHPLTPAIDIIGYMAVPPTPFQRKDWEKPDSTAMPYAKDNHIITDGYRTGRGRLEKTRLDLSSSDTIESDLMCLEAYIEKSFILVTHSPPHNTALDITNS